jgi:pyruvate dehydrogenase E2 component (dihydrolipoamide acetyltransferase)
MNLEVIVPVMGENIKEGQVVHVDVKEGDLVKSGQTIMEIETGKATVEIPSPATGKVERILAKPGERVDVGQLVMVLEGTATAPVSAQQKIQPTPVVATPPSPPPALTSTPKIEAARLPDHVPVAAAPSVRRFARELGVNISEVAPSHPSGRLSLDDVKAHVKRANTTRNTTGWSSPNVALPDFSKFGVVREEPMSTIRTRTADHMAAAWATIPHVTQHARARVDILETMRKKLGARLESQGTRLTVTAFLIKIVASSLERFPKFNASIDTAQKKVVFKEFINIGIAVDTERGLLVPVVKNANKKTIAEIAKDLAQISEKARSGKLSPDDMSGGTFTITNLGSIGGGFFTPIVNAPEVAILGVSRTVQECVPDAEGKPSFAGMLPLSLSYDHRLIDGAEGARFVMALVEAIEDPTLLLLN